MNTNMWFDSLIWDRIVSYLIHDPTSAAHKRYVLQELVHAMRRRPYAELADGNFVRHYYYVVSPLGKLAMMDYERTAI